MTKSRQKTEYSPSGYKVLQIIYAGHLKEAGEIVIKLPEGKFKRSVGFPDSVDKGELDGTFSNTWNPYESYLANYHSSGSRTVAESRLARDERLETIRAAREAREARVESERLAREASLRAVGEAREAAERLAAASAAAEELEEKERLAKEASDREKAAAAEAERREKEKREAEEFELAVERDLADHEESDLEVSDVDALEIAVESEDEGTDTDEDGDGEEPGQSGGIVSNPDLEIVVSGTDTISTTGENVIITYIRV